MPQTKHRRIPKYRLHKGSGQAVVGIDGRDLYLGPHGSPQSHERYARIIAEWTAGGYQLPPDPDADLAVVELVARYLRYAQQHYRRANGSATAEIVNVKQALGVLKRLYSSLPAKSFGPVQLRACRQVMIDNGLCRGTCNARTQTIKRAFRWAAGQAMIPGEILHGLDAVESLERGRTEAHDNPAVGPVAEAAVDAIRPHVSRQVWAIVSLMRLTGARSGEITSMRACDLDMSGRVWVFTPAHHKTSHRNRPRQILIGPRGQEIIRPFLTRSTTAFLFSPAAAEAERSAQRRADRKSPMTPSQRARGEAAKKRLAEGRRQSPPGDRYTSLSLAKAIRRACDDAEIPRWTPHRLRHSFATSLRKSHGLEASQLALGHSSASITDAVYAERDLTKLETIMLEVG